MQSLLEELRGLTRVARAPLEHACRHAQHRRLPFTADAQKPSETVQQQEGCDALPRVAVQPRQRTRTHSCIACSLHFVPSGWSCSLCEMPWLHAALLGLSGGSGAGCPLAVQVALSFLGLGRLQQQRIAHSALAVATVGHLEAGI